MFRVVGICPHCTGGEFKKEEDIYLTCLHCDSSYCIDELVLIDIEE